MPMTERCGMCAHFKVIEGIFGDCPEKDDTCFSADPKCGAFILKQQKAAVDSTSPSFSDFGSRRVIDPNTLGFMGMGLPMGFIPIQGQPPPPAPEPEKTEWKSPVFKRVKSKHKPRKVIDLAEAIAERKKK